MTRSMLTKTVVTMASVLLLLGCGGGGGGGSNDTSGTAEGLWFGTTSQGRSVAGLVLSDGEYWFLYSAINDPNIVAGLIQGSGDSANNEFQSSNAKDFNLELFEIFNGTVSGNYSERETLDGVASAAGGGSVTFNLDYDQDYEATPTLAFVAGTYSGEAATAGGYDSATVTVSGTGALTTVSVGGCQGTGSVTPRSDAYAYDVSVTFLGGNCANGTSTVSGILFIADDNVTAYAAALNSSRTNGFIFLGSRQ